MFESSTGPALFHSLGIYKGTSPVCSASRLWDPGALSVANTLTREKNTQMRKYIDEESVWKDQFKKSV